MKKKLMAIALSCALVAGLNPGAALAAGGPEDAELAAGGAVSQLAPQAKMSGAVAKAVAACNALPAPAKVKLTDVKAVSAAFTALSSAVVVVDGEYPDDYYTKQDIDDLSAAYEKYKTVYNALDSLVKSESSKAKKAKSSGLKAQAGKKKATVSWKSLGGNYRYEVYYSLQKGRGYEKAATTQKSKVTVKKLQSGKKYYFKIRGVRTDIPLSAASDDYYQTIYTKYSVVVASKAIK